MPGHELWSFVGEQVDPVRGFEFDVVAESPSGYSQGFGKVVDRGVSAAVMVGDTPG